MSTPRTLRRSLSSLLTAGALAASSLLVLAPAASAEYGVVADRGGSSDGEITDRRDSYGEISRVEVNFQQQRLVVRVRSIAGDRGADFWNVWIDTSRTGAKPQRLVQYAAPYGPERYATAYATRAWSPFPPRDTAVCGQVARKVTRDRGPVVEVRIPLRCLPAGSERARVSVGTFMEYGNADWAPARRAWSRWFSRG
ncbi:hypothetical protein [Nocardioides sp. CFH 31398]|uniref:hypothetical protein n=1 Tax=Nocardioides sp. CFH 31398 TaxID=2919579 RepID=UPI001F06C703|nr:hypothetical protein [Nocardioides sp. CFH 31398]MCH1866458.1 hypothetical protein [Nocardioides sp. CFH 31398]